MLLRNSDGVIFCISIGATKTTALYMGGDTLHQNRQGAEKLAELFATQFKQKPGTQVTVSIQQNSLVLG